jgi:uroporphyrinogen-III synthase
MGLPAFGLPLFTVEPVAWTAPDWRNFDGLLLTSANAVRQAGPTLAILRQLPVYAVGQATAAAAAKAGLTVASLGDAGVDELLRSLPPSLALLHLCGEHRRAPAAAAQRLVAVPVYHSATLPSPQGVERLAGSVALVHSPRAGRRLAELAPARERTRIAAISPAAAAACGAGWEAVATAGRPEGSELLSLAARLCEVSQP